MDISISFEKSGGPSCVMFVGSRRWRYGGGEGCDKVMMVVVMVGSIVIIVT